MKPFLLILAIAACVQTVNAQTGTPQKTKVKTCFDEYYEAFTSRGATVVPDGEHNVVIAIRKGDSTFCGEGRVSIKNGLIIPAVMVKKEDGTYETAKKVLHPNTMKDENPQGTYTVHEGMSSTFRTEDDFLANLFFTDFLKRKVVPNAQAPSPGDISGIQIELNTKEKEIIRKAYEGLQFDNGKSTIKSPSFPHLNLLADMMKEKKEFKLDIKGYTDNVGKAESNLTLSRNRAYAVKNYLIKQGVEETRITAEGYGMENPIGDNNTSEGRAKNRRVEFIMVQ